MMRKQEEGNRDYYYFPEEIWWQILCLIPAQSLIAFRIVSKLFRSIIDNPEFISSHLSTTRNRNNLQYNLLTLITKLPTHEGLELKETRNSHICECDNKGCSYLKLPQLWYQSGLVGSLDGIFLFHSNSVAKLWNPLTRRVKTLTLPEESSNPFTGLAYDSLSKDYKVVCIAYNPVVKVWIYSLNTGCWSSVEDCGISSTTHPVLHRTPRSYFFDGALHWIEDYWKDYKSLKHRIVRFELGKMKMSYLYSTSTTIWPLNLQKGNITNNTVVMLDGGSTLGMYGSDMIGTVNIWEVGIDGDVFWLKKRYKFPHYWKFRCHHYVCVSNNGKYFLSIDFGTTTAEVFYYSLIMDDRRRYWIDYSSGIFYLMDHSYVQSLIHI